ncbi:aminotransferase class IV [Mangrovibacterium marinum]|uniref:Branched-subunit amino acid aminotransferase/4-amino-4-deoxychorismate lyase n=1 Tax=Mangrovibacterium marinum TaxID=1639118 RepID=A0A2T5BZW3_9BACT|nr:aminotransferase class IV [Mangrovibacterium marinum]PTN07850.1 branched-subunit amino acid aminotransferase/4-amino-4-deoxychorismate lyase [Mangrovibacterium marinum]
MGQFILYNKKLHPCGEPVLTAGKLQHLLFTDQLRMLKSQMPFWEDHLRLWKLHFKIFKIDEPDFLAHEGKDLRRQIERAIHKNRCFKGATIRISFLFNEGTVGYLIEINPHRESSFVQNPDGYQLELFRQFQKSDSPLSALQLGSEPIWTIARAHSRQSGNIPLITNTKHSLLETPGANIYFIKNKQLYTPSPGSGCYINPAKRVIAQLCEQIGFALHELDQIYEDDIQDVDEAFIANDTDGVQYVRGFGMKRFYRRYSQQIANGFERLLIH